VRNGRDELDLLRGETLRAPRRQHHQADARDEQREDPGAQEKVPPAGGCDDRFK
jgi:hypothetical protein